ncbi:WGR domain-containing protein [Bosea rubneri]|uniref:WGR domain-containing protein n=1 Tax=Bosea rubneri TaxID=3075434 RepID=A0ABU3SHB7_9HYPH|nr:WGR domain-containing protein [Bosea sp. ZW T0_25]MDU0343782.1 WGR domain-containing protein [Bosea sp. ZW T0_25]
MDSTLNSNPPRLQMLVLDRTDRPQNMARFYVLSVEPTLFGDAALVREWGRWGHPGRRRLDLFPDFDKAAEALEDWLLRKARRGYRIVGRGDGEEELVGAE